MPSKDDILKSIHQAKLPPVELPSLEEDWVTYDDPADRFSQALEVAGGRCISAVNGNSLEDVLGEIPHYADAKKVCSLVPGISRADVILDAVDDPHDLRDVDFAILPAEFAVAENGAVWLTDATLRHRAIVFLAEHLAIVVPRSQILNNMHEAYQRLTFGEREFGLFLCGPSKTADIEQALVIGAHGARSLTAILCEDN